MDDYIVRGDIKEIDPRLYELIRIEEERFIKTLRNEKSRWMNTKLYKKYIVTSRDSLKRHITKKDCTAV